MSYGQVEERNQDDYHEKRSREMLRIYKKQGFSSYHPLDKRIKRDQELRIHTQLEQPPNYKDYLEKEIDRRKALKDSQKKQQKEKEKIMIEKMTVQARHQQERERELLRNQRLSFKTGLDEQIAYRHIK